MGRTTNNEIFHYWLPILRDLLPSSLLEELEQKESNRLISQERIYIEHLIRLVKIFRVGGERFRLNSQTYQQVMLVICGLVRLRIEAFQFSF